MGTGTKVFIVIMFIIGGLIFLIVFALSSAYKATSEASDQIGGCSQDFFTSGNSGS